MKLSNLTRKNSPVCRWWHVTVLLAISLLSNAAAQRPLGIDVSHWQGTINWTNVKNAGIVFAWCKATEGTGYTDPTFTANMAGAKAQGILIGGYHFARYDQDLGTNGAIAEAQHYWAVVKNYVTNGGFYMVPCLDSEYVVSNSVSTTPGNYGYTQSTYSQWCNAWSATIVSNAAAKGITLKPMMYSGVSFGSTWNNSTVTNNFYCWKPNWNGQDPQTGAPSGTSPFSAWNFWQWDDAGSVSGITGNVDMDVYNGSASGLAPFIIGGFGPPLFVSSPSGRFAEIGDSLLMRVSAVGAATLKYQWRFKGNAIVNATNSTYTLPNIQTASNGNYTVIVSNTVGSITSAIAKVTVSAAYTPVFSDDFDVNSSSSWTLSKSGTDTKATWAWDYSTMGIPSAPNTTNGTTKGLKLEANMKNGNVQALNVSPNGQAFSAPYRLHFDAWINYNGPLVGGTGTTQMISAGVGTTGGHVQWNNSGAAADGVWFTVDGDGGAGSTSTTQGDYVAYVGTNQQAVADGVYASSATRTTARGSSDYYYQNVFPGGVTAPQFQRTNYANMLGSTPAGAVGFAWRDVIVDDDSTNVTCYIDGLKIATVPDSTITASNIFVGYWDPFSSVSDNTNCSFGVIDNVRVEVPLIAPAIVSQPVNTTVTQGSNAVFTVSATGSPTPTYIWRFNGTPINNATNSTYTKINAQAGDVGSYSVIVSNVASTVTSSTAALTLNIPPNISAQPQSQTVNQTSNATFTVTASGTAPLAYQWRLNAINISGATGSAYTRTNSQPADAGSYTVVVTNSAGTLTSAVAILTVIVPPSISAQPQSVAVNISSNASFSVAASGSAPFAYQWRFNTAPISGATLSSYTRTNAQAGDVGSYSVVVTNAAGAATSANAVLSLNQPPSITTQPQSRTAGQNSDVVFSVGVSGTAPFGYQWRYNGSNIAAATNSTYTRLHVQAQDVGSYSVVVTNIAGSTTSVDATLVLSPCTVRILNVVSNADATVGMTWSIDAGNNYTLEYKDSLTDANWTAVTVTNASSSSVTYNLSRTNAQRFYHLASECAESDPAGFIEVSLPGNSDSFVSLPFVRSAVATATVGSIAGSVITASIQYPTTWISNQFVYVAGTQPNKFYARFTSGAAQGPIYPVTANDTNTVTLDTSSNSIASAISGDTLVIAPFPTLNSVFPNGAGVNVSPTVGNRNTEVLIPDFTTSGINLSSSKIYFFNGGLWKQVGQGNADHGDDVLQPNAHFIVRHNVATNTTLLALGVADTSAWTLPLRTPDGSAGDKQDNYIGLARPVSVSLDASGLINSGAFAASPLPGSRTDELLVFDNTAIAKNKSSATVYYYWNSAWRRVGAGSTVVGADTVFTPGTGVIIRKGTNNVSPVWTNAPSY